ncbi:hypothetical protein D3C78_1840530 [compost metagenome]
MQTQLDRVTTGSAVKVKILVDHAFEEIRTFQLVFFGEYTRFIYQRAGEEQVVFCCLCGRQPEAGDDPGAEVHGPLAHRCS